VDDEIVHCVVFLLKTENGKPINSWFTLTKRLLTAAVDVGISIIRWLYDSMLLDFDRNSIPLRPLRPVICPGPLHWINNHAKQRLAGYVTVTLMTFDKQSNGRRIEVES